MAWKSSFKSRYPKALHAYSWNRHAVKASRPHFIIQFPPLWKSIGQRYFGMPVSVLLPVSFEQKPCKCSQLSSFLFLSISMPRIRMRTAFLPSFSSTTPLLSSGQVHSLLEMVERSLTEVGPTLILDFVLIWNCHHDLSGISLLLSKYL